MVRISTQQNLGVLMCVAPGQSVITKRFITTRTLTIQLGSSTRMGELILRSQLPNLGSLVQVAGKHTSSFARP